MTPHEIAATHGLPHIAIVAYACHLRPAADPAAHTVTASPARLAEALVQTANRRASAPSTKTLAGALARLEAAGLLVRLPAPRAGAAPRYLLPMLPLGDSGADSGVSPGAPEATPAKSYSGVDGTNRGADPGFVASSSSSSSSSSTSSSSTSSTSTLTAMSADWLPTEATLDQLRSAGVPREFAEGVALAEFRAYWLAQPAGTRRPWDARFVLAAVQCHRALAPETPVRGARTRPDPQPSTAELAAELDRLERGGDR